MAKVQNDRPRLIRAYAQATALTALVYLPLTGGVIILAPELIRVLLGPQWGEVVLPFQILAAGLLFRANKVNLTVAQATGAVYSRAWREGIYGGLVVIGALVGLRWGLAGVAGGVLVALLANFVLMAQLTLGVTGVTWRQYAQYHLPALRLALMALVIVWPVAGALRSMAAPALLTLMTAGTAAGGALLLLVYYLPQTFVGPEGLWLLDTVLEALPKRLSAALPWLKAGRRGGATY
jgi:PST family polysaccharide transporter